MEAVVEASAVPRAGINRWLVLVLVCVAQFMVVLDATIVNVALPSIQHGLGFSRGTCSGSSTRTPSSSAASCCSAAAPPTCSAGSGSSSRAWSSSPVASLINGIATSSGVLVGGRALQGLGAALVSPAALSIVTTTFKEGSERTKALGVWSAIAAGGGAVGLILGGLLTETLSWRWVFFINLPIGIAAALLSLRFIPNSRAEKRPETARRRRRRHGHRRAARARLRRSSRRRRTAGHRARRSGSACSRSPCSARSS